MFGKKPSKISPEGLKEIRSANDPSQDEKFAKRFGVTAAYIRRLRLNQKRREYHEYI